MMNTAHNSIYEVRGLTQVGRVDKPISLEIAFESICSGRRTWFYDFK